MALVRRIARTMPTRNAAEREDCEGEALLRLTTKADLIAAAANPKAAAARTARRAMLRYLMKENPEYRRLYWGRDGLDTPAPADRPEDAVVAKLDSQRFFATAPAGVHRYAAARLCGRRVSDRDNVAMSTYRKSHPVPL